MDVEEPSARRKRCRGDFIEKERNTLGMKRCGRFTEPFRTSTYLRHNKEGRKELKK